MRKGKSQNECFKKIKKNEHFLTRTRTGAYQGVRDVRFSDNLACFDFLKHLF